MIEVIPLKKPVVASVNIPGSKSYTNRALILAAMTPGTVVLHHPLYSEDTEAMISCLKELGLRIECFPDRLHVHDDISVVQNKSYQLNAKDSGTTMRFLTALLCLTPGVKIIGGSSRLNERPIADLVDALRLLGAKIEYMDKEGQAPLKIHSKSSFLTPSIALDASITSQFLSAILMIAPFCNGLAVQLTGHPISEPYIDMTIQLMKDWGVDIIHKDAQYCIPSNQKYHKEQYPIEGDYSSAGYYFAMAILTKSTITLNNLNPYSIQADKEFLKMLNEMGNPIEMHHDSVTIHGSQFLPCEIDMERCPDQVQTMAVLAAFGNGVTTISGVRSLRVKETERVQALKNELEKMGIRTEDSHDTLKIFGGAPKPAKIDTYGDHRMAMAFAVAGTKIPGVYIKNPEVVDKTFPTFWQQLDCIQKAAYGK